MRKIKYSIKNILFKPLIGLILSDLKLIALGEKCIPFPTQN